MDEKLNAIVADLFDVDINTVSDDMTSDTLEGWDSMNNLRFITALEQEFGVRFTMTEIGELNSIGKVRAYIKDKAGR